MRLLGVDTNVLIYAHIASFAQHQRARAFLERQLNTAETALAVTPLVLHEFLHIVTDARRFDPPLRMSEALQLTQTYLQRENVACLTLDEEVVLETLRLLDRHQLGRKRIADTLFAATLLRHGVQELVTCNLDDYRQFSGLVLIDPLDGP